MKQTEQKSRVKVKLHIKKGDTVKVLSGDSKNSTGKVLKVITDENRALVEGINIVTKHTKPTSKYPDGGRIKIEAPIHISNLMVMENGAPTKIGRKLNENNKLQRFSKKSGEFIK